MRIVLKLNYLLFIFFISCWGDEPLASSQSQTFKVKELKVVTYNLHYFDRGFQPILRTIKELNADVIALQEVLVHNGVDYSKLIARKLKYYHLSSSPYVSYRNGKYKWVLSFLSKYPMKKVSEKWLQNYRLAFKVRVSVDGQGISFINTHLSPFTWPKKGVLKANIRRSERRQKEVNDLIQWAGKPLNPSVLLGDFNCLPMMKELKLIKNIGYRDVYGELNESHKETYQIDNKELSKRLKRYLPLFSLAGEITLDYIFIGGMIKTLSVNVIHSDASDHYPVKAKIIIPIKKR